jgi:Mn2+/Fe2+ NRAMP family transporter
VVLSARKSIMGEFALSKAAVRVAAAATILIVLLNLVLIGQLFS